MTSKATNVLVVEDDLPTLNLERLILEGGGYTVTSAVRGEDAVEIVADASPDLILLDIGLPGIDGFTTCKVIRKFSQVPIIMVTGSSSSGDKVKGLEIGADDYITKPFTEEELFARSKAVLRRSTVGGKAGGRVNRLCGRVWGSLHSADYIGAARSVCMTARRPYLSLRRRIREQRDITREPANSLRARVRQYSHILDLKDRTNSRVTTLVRDSRWPVILERAKLSLLSIHRTLYRCAAKLALSLKKISRSVSNSPVAIKVKSSGPAMKLAEATAHFLQSECVGNLRYRCRKLWETGSGFMTSLLVSLRKKSSPQLLFRLEECDRVEGEVEVRVCQPTPSLHRMEPASSLTPDQTDQVHRMAFLEKLLRAYLKEAEKKCGDPMVSTPVVPLVDVYQQIVLSSEQNREYSKEEFARDVFLLHCSGVDTTSTGARVQFPISRGVPNKTLVIISDAGEEVRYYGIRFMQTQGPDCKDFSAGKYFDSSEVAQYRAEVREAFRRQLEWPSEEFALFFAAQIHLRDLNQQERRLFAQVTRDALQEFINGCLGDRVRSDAGDQDNIDHLQREETG